MTAGADAAAGGAGRADVAAPGAGATDDGRAGAATPGSGATGAGRADAAALVAALRDRGWTVAVAESLTGGRLAARLVDVPGASAVLLGGIVAYATELKARLVGVDAALLAERGPVDGEVARQLADRVRDACAVDGRPADLGLATTGVAGPDPQDGVPPGTVHVGIASPRGIRSVELALDGSRDEVREVTVARAIAEALGEVVAAPSPDAPRE